ncbi:MAG TPA: NUDIX hydrolase [Syntrophales bacterium]|nr:NUDIX hydrolase [Syntrophales bacterium]HOM08051.1 NUDIX hydrolase [Syntrophales bacterium]HON99825.1 NUDIX hydrolase [Syntrophales bacterium]HPC01458.1 NUDIX hydrolase [Syntrophales bacterium]HPQ07478.1 NUDIX hydrolase [Syntrophales bacterium]
MSRGGKKREYPDHPVVGVGAVVLREGRVLLVKRGVEPRRGLWAVPGGTLRLGETLSEGAERETYEETGVRVKAGEVIYVFDLIEKDEEGRSRFHFVVVDLEAEYVDGEAKGADDALEARWVSPEECLLLPMSANTVKLLRARGFLP